MPTRRAADLQRDYFADCLMADAWRFFRTDGSVVAPVLRLLPRGLVGGYICPSERGWALRHGKLVFLDIDGIATTVFTDVVFDPHDGRPLRLSGQVRFYPHITHVLERTQMPTALDFGQNSRQTQPEFVTRIDRPRRQNLVVLRADANSLHTQWPRDIDDDDRNWDLCVSWYGSGAPTDLGQHEYLTIQPEDRKFGAINALFQANSPLWGYDQVWLPDDDLMTSWRDINRLFQICWRHLLVLAQPSLKADSYVNHPATAQNPDNALRFTRFVELMCPVFAIDALRLCLPTFNGAVSGFGLDHIWQQLLGHVHSRMAIIDDVAVSHTRPMAKSYDIHEALMEQAKILGLYGTVGEFVTVGGLQRERVLL